MSGRRTPKVAQKQQEKQQALVRAAVALFGDKGYHKTSIKDIACAAGVATGTFYLYFPKKEALLAALVEEFYQRLLESIHQKRKEAGGDIKGKLVSSMQTVLQFFGDHSRLARIALIEVARTSPQVRERVLQKQNELSKFIEEDLREAVAKGLIPEQDCRLTAEAIVGSFSQVIFNRLDMECPSSWKPLSESLVTYSLRGAGFKDRC